MKLLVHTFLIYFLLLCLPAPSNAQRTEAQIIPASILQEDFDLLKDALTSLHPGLYRYQSEADVQAHFDDLEKSLQSDMTHAEAFAAFSAFIPKLLCGHTLVNPFNQSDFIKDLIFYTEDKVPFEFELVEGQMIVTRSVSEQVEEGMNIHAINDRPVASIIEQLMQFVSADGANNGKRSYELQLTGFGAYELFDVYFPLIVPPTTKGYAIKATRKGESTPSTIYAQPISRSERQKQVNEKYGPLPQTYDDLWEFKVLDDKTGYLKAGTFVTYKMDLNWRRFLKDAFDTMKRDNIPNLIVDIRGNAGGMDMVGEALLRSIGSKPATIPATDVRLAYQKVPERLRPYLNTWDDKVFDLSKKVVDSGNGYYVEKKASTKPKTYKPQNKAYKGNVYLLVDAANSSNTFFVARTAKQNKLATLVGEETGGNLMGTNGGMMFFLSLPNTKVGIDVPIYGYYPLDDQPNRGIIPDVVANRTVEDVQEGVDTILQAALKEIE
ncbi:MAG: hypothetical protein KTR29_02815 [Rhodothermaceae bacterium]|nr:hypothetical protein [Rhodothermaceae bacterium]